MEGYYVKRAKCPVCHQEVEIPRLKYGAYAVTSRDSDLHPWVSGPNPIYYLPVVCGSCGYAALESKFEEISQEENRKLLPFLAKKRLSGVKALDHDRSVEDAINGLMAVFEQYQLRGVDAYTLGHIAHNIAWLYRELGDSDHETEWLSKTLSYYLKAYESDARIPDAIGESGLAYLIADLWSRLGDYRQALQWASRVVQMPTHQKKPLFDQLSRELWQSLREKSRSQAPQEQPWQTKVRQQATELLFSKSLPTDVYDSLVKNLGLWSLMESLWEMKKLNKEEIQQVASFEWLDKVKELSKGRVVVQESVAAVVSAGSMEPPVYVFPETEPKPPCIWVCDRDDVSGAKLLWRGYGFVKGKIRQVFIWEVQA